MIKPRQELEISEGAAEITVARGGASGALKGDMETLGKWVFTAVKVLAGIYILTYSFSFFNLADEGITAMSAWRITQGQVPYRDFFELEPPVSFYTTALFVKFLGPTVLAVRLPVILLALALLWLTDSILKKLSVNGLTRAAAFVYLVPFGVAFWPIPSHHWYATVLQLCAMLALAAGTTSGRPFAWAFAGGASCALTVLSLHDQGGYLVIALAPLFFPLIKERALRKKMFLGWAAGGAAVAIPSFALLANYASLREVMYQWVQWPMQQYKNLPGNEVGIRELVNELGDMWDSLPNDPFNAAVATFNTALHDLLPILAAAFLILAFFKRWADRDKLGLVAACAISAVGTLMHRIAPINIVWVAPFLLIPILIGLSRAMNGQSKAARRACVVSIIILIALPAGYSLSIAARLFDRVPFNCPAGTMFYFKGDGENVLNQIALVGAVEKLVPKSEPLFVRGFIPHICYLTHHENPTRFNYIIHPLYYTDDQAREAMGALETRGVDYAVSDRTSTGRSFLVEYLESNFGIVWHNKDYAILKRKGARQPEMRPPMEGPDGKKS